jgi:hypothetical protein
MHDLVAFQATGMIKVELFDAFAGREPDSRRVGAFNARVR